MSAGVPIQPSAALPPPGTLLAGKYRLERYLAEGGMSTIAVGHHVQLDEPIALKFLKPDVIAADPTAAVAGRFVREARATFKIRSEHVPRIFDVATLETGVPYIVMELLSGEDLDQRLEREGPLPVRFVVDVTLQALEAIAAAHALGIIHRDLKPANIFLSTRLDGTLCAKVLDFGIAKLAEQTSMGKDHGLTTTNAVMGSPRYMSPEQMRGSRDVDARADIWAIGTTMYELLAGVSAFGGENLTQVCAAVLQDEPAPLSSMRRDLPHGLDVLVQRCLAKRADDRYADVGELAMALAPFGSSNAAEDAARVVRVLESGGATSSRRLGAPSTARPRPSDARISETIRVDSKPDITPPSAPEPMAGTNTSWGTAKAAPVARRSWLVPAVFLVGLAVVGGGLGGAALLSRGRAPVAASAPPPPALPKSADAPPASAPMPVAPVISAPVVAPSSAPAATTAPAAVGKPRTKPAAVAPDPPRPVDTTPPPPAPPTPKPPQKKDLWDDRK